MVLAGIGLSFLASSVFSTWADVLSNMLMPAGFGIAFLASLATPTPLLARFAGRRAANNPERAARLNQPDVVKALTRLNVIWGPALLADAALALVLSNSMSASQFGLIGTVLGFGGPALLGAATLAYVRHRRSPTIAIR